MNFRHFLIASAAFAGAFATVSAAGQNVPDEVRRPGYWLQAEVRAQTAGDPAMERVMLFSRDNGHYPCFDLFKIYYAIVDESSGRVKYLSDELLSTGRELNVEDRNGDGLAELHIRHIEGGNFTVDDKGNNLRARWVYETIEPDKL